jgi:DMSO/TMAO reductase YedYZ molybdopterin-dependent catalytic subunit
VAGVDSQTSYDPPDTSPSGLEEWDPTSTYTAEMKSQTSLEPTDGPLTLEELQLATRNRGMPLEALEYDVTPSGLHYLLIHFDIPRIDAATWRLRVGGRVRHPLELSLADIRDMPSQTLPVTLECAGNGRARLSPRPLSQPWLVEAVSTAEWTGTSLAGVLAAAGIDEDAQEIVFTGADRGVQGDSEHDYARSLSLADAQRPEVLLVYEMNGRPLEPQHGYPLRLIVPGWYGMTSVKWLTTIEAVNQPFMGFQQADAYHYRQSPDELGEAVSRIRPRALMVPPGIPDYFTRRRLVERGRRTMTGRAWSGQAPIKAVEFGVDGRWQPAEMASSVGEFAWRGWSAAWDALPGEHELSCRATDEAGTVQPTEQPWNYQGMGNNLVQIVPVTVR